MLPPDFIGVDDLRKIPVDYRAAQYQQYLLGANSAKKDGRHYVDGAHHYVFPESCWIIDPNKNHFVDIHVGIDNSKVVGGLQNRESVVMIRNVTKIDAPHDDHMELLERLMLQCMELPMSEAEGNARGKTVDRGTMFALGTKIPYGEKKDPATCVSPKVPTTAPFAANRCVSDSLLRNMVVNMATIGSCCFPQVYSVIRDTEENSGLIPVSPMNGEAIPMVTGDCDGDGDSDSDSDFDPGSDNNADDDAETIAILKRRALARIAIRKRIALLQRRRRVGYTIDTSVNLGNLSHFDVHDASQCYSV